MTYSLGAYASGPYAGVEFADIPVNPIVGHRLAYDADATRVMAIDDALIDPVGLTLAQRRMLNDEVNVGVIDPDLLVGAPGSGLLFVFPDTLHLTGVFLAGDFGIASVEVSYDSTDGRDGTWAVVSGPVSTHSDADSGYRTAEPLSEPHAPVRALRVRQYGTAGVIRALHLYGEYLDDPDRLVIWSAQSNVRLGVTDWATGLDGTTSVDFRIHNLSDRAAIDVLVSIESLSGFPLREWSRLSYASDPEIEYETIYIDRVEAHSTSDILRLTTTIYAPAQPELQSARVRVDDDRPEASSTLWTDPAGAPVPEPEMATTISSVAGTGAPYLHPRTVLLTDTRMVYTQDVSPGTLFLINPATGADLTSHNPASVSGVVTDMLRLTDLHFVIVRLAGTTAYIEVWGIGADTFTLVASDTYVLGVNAPYEGHDIEGVKLTSSFVERNGLLRYEFNVVVAEKNLDGSRMGVRVTRYEFDANTNALVKTVTPSTTMGVTESMSNHNDDAKLLNTISYPTSDPTKRMFAFFWLDVTESSTTPGLIFYRLKARLSSEQATGHFFDFISEISFAVSTEGFVNTDLGRIDHARLLHLGDQRAMFIWPRSNVRMYSYVNEFGNEQTVNRLWRWDCVIIDYDTRWYRGPFSVRYGLLQPDGDPEMGPVFHDDRTAAVTVVAFNGTHLNLAVSEFVDGYTNEEVSLSVIDTSVEPPVQVGFAEDLLIPEAGGAYWYLTNMFARSDGSLLALHIGGPDAQFRKISYTLP